MKTIDTVVFSKQALKDLRKVPKYLVLKLQAWVFDIELYGLHEVMKIPGYHDEPLKGQRSGQRSIRLNRAYRAIYHILDNGDVEFIEVLEVNKHDY